MIQYAITEGMSESDFEHLPFPMSSIQDMKAVPAELFFELHEYLDDTPGPGYAVRVGQQMKIKDCGVLGLSLRTCSKAGEIFERSERYFHLLSNTYVFKVEEEALLNDLLNGQIIEVTGPEKITFPEIVQVIARATNRTIHFQEITLKDYTDFMRAAGLPVDYIWLMEYLFTEVLGNPGNQVISDDIERVLGRKATEFSEYAKKTAKTGVWHQNVPQII